MKMRLAAVVTAALAVGVAWATPASAHCRHHHHLPASLSISPPTFSVVSTHPFTQTFVVTNTGGRSTAALAVSLSFAYGNAFQVTSDGCSGTTLAPSKTCSVDVTWEAGFDTGATLTVSDATTQVSASLYGSGVP